MRGWSTGVRGAIAAAAVAASAAAGPRHLPVPEHPILVEATVCALPGPACPDPDEVLRLVIDGTERRVGFSDLVVLDGSVTAGTIYSALRVRPVRLFGAPDVLAALTPGTPRRLRAVVRLGAQYLFADRIAPLREPERGP